MSLSDSRRNLAQNFVNIVLCLVSVVQGLAFSFLTTRLPAIWDYTVSSHDWVYIAHYALCFILILRVFQTYTLAALEYYTWSVGFIDLFMVFAVGSLEYVLFDTLSLPRFDASRFYTRFLVLCLAGLIGYVMAFIRVGSSIQEKRVVLRERLIQSINMAILAVASATCSFVLSFATQSTLGPIIASMTISAMLVANMAASLGLTLRSIKSTRDDSAGPTDGCVPQPDAADAKERDDLCPERVLWTGDKDFPDSRDLAPATNAEAPEEMVAEKMVAVITASKNVVSTLAIDGCCCCSIRIHPRELALVDRVAIYQAYPVSAITLTAIIAASEFAAQDDTALLHLAEPEHGPYIPRQKDGRNRAPRSPKLVPLQRLEAARTLDDLW